MDPPIVVVTIRIMVIISGSLYFPSLPLLQGGGGVQLKDNTKL